MSVPPPIWTGSFRANPLLGIVLWLVMATAIAVSAWKVLRQSRGSPWFPIGIVIFCCAFLMLFPFMVGGIQAYEDFVLNAYLWLLLGVLFRLPHVKVSAELEAAQLASARPRRRWIL